MPPMLKKFIIVLNMFLYSPHKEIYGSASLGQKKLIKTSNSGTKLALKLVSS